MAITFHQKTSAEERTLRAYIESEPAFSETAASISAKLGVSAQTARRVLDRYAEIGLVQRRTFGGHIEPVYSRFRMWSRPG